MVTSPAHFFNTAVDSAEKQFLMYHHLRHITYDKAASRSGVSLPGLDLTGKVNHDWLFRHSMRHKTYRRLAGGGSSTIDLESLDWENKRAVRSWMQYHAQLHSDLDQFFGIRS